MLVPKQLFLVTVLISMVPNNMAVMFTIPHKLSSLFFTEEMLIKHLNQVKQIWKNWTALDQYLELAQHRLNQVNMLERFDPNNLSLVEDHMDQIMEELVGNPMHVYSLVNRIRMRIIPLYEELKLQPDLAAISEKINVTLSSIEEMPTAADMEGVTQSIARIQFAYRYNPVDMANGVVGGKATAARLTVANCFNIAQRRYSGVQPLRPDTKYEYALAIEWAEAALRLIDKMDNFKEEHNKENEISRTAIESFLVMVKSEHDQYWEPPKYGVYPNEEFFISRFSEYDYPVSGRDMRNWEAEEPTKHGFILGPRNFEYAFNIHDFYSLCRGEKLMQFNNDQLGYYDEGQICILTNEDDPYFLLAPLKVEVLMSEPFLGIFRDILTYKEVEDIKKKAISRFTTATVQAKQGENNTKITNERIAAAGFFRDEEDVFFHKLSKKIKRFTHLECTRPDEELYGSHSENVDFIEAEPAQVGIYGPGGHYLPHHDSFKADIAMEERGPNNIWLGNRIATVLFYLSDLVGGYTIFPELGKSAIPSKGSAVFWYNLDASGKRDTRFMHGACPTVLGIKWVLNKWIREGAQIWKEHRYGNIWKNNTINRNSKLK